MAAAVRGAGDQMPGFSPIFDTKRLQVHIMAKAKRVNTRVNASPKKGAKKPARRPIFWFFAKWIATAAVWALIIVGLGVAWYATNLPDVDQALSATRRPTVTVVAADGAELATFGDLYGAPLSLKELPPALPNAVLAIEDRRFYSHFGVDPRGLTRAAVANLRAGRIVQGGSTITQQLAKNLFLTPERTFSRKAQEFILALWLERKFTKDEILTIYLNRMYLGAGAYGVDAAAWRYFGRSAKQLSTYESAMLAGLLKAPSRYNPRANLDAAKQRTNLVLSRMSDVGFLSADQMRRAKAEAERMVLASSGRYGRYFVDWVLEQVSDYVSPDDRDLVVVTTLDPLLQGKAERAVAAILESQGKAAGAGEAALVGLSPDGAVRAMVGGGNYRRSQFNRAAQAHRQPGSAFKPVVYMAGLEAGLTPATQMTDAPITIDGWSPRNFDGRHLGPVTLQDAMAKSLNSVAVRVTERVGRQRVVDTARKLGLTAELSARPSLALGAGEVSLIELTAVYAVLANGGRGVWPYGIQEIRDRQGNVLYRREGSGPGAVVDGEHVTAMNQMLAEVLVSGTGRAAAFDRPAAGKTGTSQSFRDAWFMGFTADLVAGVWMGNDDARPMKSVTGGGLPARLWRDFMVAAHDGLPKRPLPGLDFEGRPEKKEPEGFWQRLLAGFKPGTYDGFPQD